MSLLTEGSRQPAARGARPTLKGMRASAGGKRREGRCDGMGTIGCSWWKGVTGWRCASYEHQRCRSAKGREIKIFRAIQLHSSARRSHPALLSVCPRTPHPCRGAIDAAGGLGIGRAWRSYDATVRERDTIAEAEVDRIAMRLTRHVIKSDLYITRCGGWKVYF